MSIEKANEIVKKLMSGELGCTIEEFKTAIKGNKELNENELETVSGGIALGHGGCKNAKREYYKEECSATVEEGSWCHKNDYCEFLSERYHKKCIKLLL